MLYQIGPLTMDTVPFEVGRVRRTSAADYAVKPTVGGLKPREPMGEGDDVLTLSGQLLPSKLGGMSQLKLAHALRVAQEPLPVMRGDGESFDYRVIDEIEEDHRDIQRNGVGFTVEYTMRLAKVPSPAATAAAGVIGTLVSLFAVLR
ncbi:tail assembly protein [Aurantimonas phage AmM-1]|uniref:tail protein n=1 Tax=Aurantimonas phage AmM-1 TaxID=1503929 RepID=UPI000540FD60|nr:tail protein [Aurantimonas phage AmM-1]BAP94482.1 tail assembly protein [Aurantimonas phage AmM-1]